MIDSARLLADLKGQLKLLVSDLTEQAEDADNEWGAGLRRTYQQAFERDRTGLSWVDWRDNEVDQAAVAWLVATTFLRFCEDNGLLDGARGPDSRPVPTLWVAGPDGRTARALENQTEFFRANPTLNRRDWLQEALAVLAAQPAGRGLVDPDHSPVWSAHISAEAADRLVDFWRAEHDGALVHDFTDPEFGTRFLGDLYQDLSEHAKKTYALLQTPVFVEEFILDQTLDPAIEEFGLTGLQVIDPTCGSGHFLLGAFERLLARWLEQAPALDARELVNRAMDSIHGVDLNPFAVAIARFRLTVAALRVTGDQSLVGVPRMPFHLAVGDSLLGGAGTQGTFSFDDDETEFAYPAEDVAEYRGILDLGQYHVVVGNPPYITVKDPKLSKRYREDYPTCHRQYALSVPFMELFFRLAIGAGPGQPAGCVGQITSNSFMKREFGTRLIEQFLSGRDLRTPVDLTEVIDTSGAYIPGHGTPTVVLIGRRRRAQSDTVRAVLGIRGEPGQPRDPARGLVWREITEHLHDPGFNGTYVSTVDLDRGVLASHPWSLTGGGASGLVQTIEGASARRLGDWNGVAIGGAIRAGADDAYMRPRALARERSVDAFSRPFVMGDDLRDYEWRGTDRVLFPYGDDLAPTDGLDRWLWPWRTLLARRSTFQGIMADAGLRWTEYMQFTKWAATLSLSITFAFVATHNHFVLDRGGKVFNRSAPVIKLPEAATEAEHLELLGILNSSTACFWLKQVSHNKGSTVDTKGARQTQVPWEDFYEFTGTKLQEFPLPAQLPGVRGTLLDRLAREQAGAVPAATIEGAAVDSGDVAAALTEAKARWAHLSARMIFEQEELDWEVYRLYGLIDDDLTYQGDGIDTLSLGQRAFEIDLARKVADGTEETAWFERHSSTPITELPAEWPADYRALVQRRLDVIAGDPQIALLEKPEHKRRWATPGWDAMLRDAARDALLDRLEQPELWQDAHGPATRSVSQLASALRHDEVARDLARILTGNDEPDLTAVLSDLVGEQAVPYLAALRYKPSGLEKYRAWEQVWELQRQEDAGKSVTIPVPPKYGQADFRKPTYWKARGKLDVPKDRFIAYPGVAREGDRTAVVGWAGWDHSEQARALARELTEARAAGADRETLLPLLAGLIELLPWLRQWHHEVDPAFGVSPAEAIDALVDSRLTELDATRADATAWQPPTRTRGRRPRS